MQRTSVSGAFSQYAKLARRLRGSAAAPVELVKLRVACVVIVVVVVVAFAAHTRVHSSTRINYLLTVDCKKLDYNIYIHEKLVEHLIFCEHRMVK